MNRFPVKVVSTQQSDLLQVRYFPTDFCNYNCSYCFANLENKYRYPKNTDLVIKNFRRIFDFYINNHHKTKFELTISGGGEPTLWPEIERFCKELKESHNVKIILVSNGSRTLRWWGNNSQYFDDVVLSCHHESVNLEHYINVADALYEKGVNVIAFSLMDARYWDKCVSQIDQMMKSRHPWFVEVKPIVGEYGAGIDVYNEEQLRYLESTIKRLPDSDWILKHFQDMNPFESVVLFNNDSAEVATSHSIIVNKWNNFKNWSCNVALEALAINPDGKLKGSCGIELSKFNVNEDNELSDLEAKPLRCPYNLCECGTDTHITKNASID